MASTSEIKPLVLTGKLSTKLPGTQCFQYMTVDQDDLPEALTIIFHRTIRVPDNSTTANLPPSRGLCQIYSTSTFEDKLPADVVAKGGSFIAMHEREALWIGFRAQTNFQIRVFNGGINCVSGKHHGETATGQDYVVVGPSGAMQPWLDGCATADGIVRQFVADAFGSGYSTEAQITGEDRIGGIQFEIHPVCARRAHDLTLAKRAEDLARRTQRAVSAARARSMMQTSYCGPAPTMSRGARDGGGRIGSMASPHGRLVELGKTSISASQSARRTLNRGNHADFDTMVSAPQIAGPAHLLHTNCDYKATGTAEDISLITAEQALMSLGQGGSIRQAIVKDPFPADYFDKDNAILWNVQLMAAAQIEQFLSRPAPAVPATPQSYAASSGAFFAINNVGTSGIQGEFGKVLSMAAMDKEKGKDEKAAEMAKPASFPLVYLDRDGQPLKK